MSDNDTPDEYLETSPQAYVAWLEARYKETNDSQHAALALYECSQRQLPPPLWAVKAAGSALADQRLQRPGRGKHSPAEADMAFSRDVNRAMTVKRFRQDGIARREAFQAAADELSHTEFAGTADDMENSWRRMKDTTVFRRRN